LKAKAKNAGDSLKGVYEREVNGSTSYLVSLGRDDQGKQRWRSCKTLDEATAEREAFEARKKDEGEMVWLLTPSQRADAVAALDVLRPYPGESLLAAAAFYQKNYLALIRSENLSQLVDTFISEQSGSGISQHSVRDLRYRLAPIKSQWGSRLASEITDTDVKNWHDTMKAQGYAPITRKHFLDRGSRFWRWVVIKKYAIANPFDPVAVKRPRIEPKEILFYEKIEQCEKLLAVFSKHGLREYIALGLFCGIRPSEIELLRKKHFRVDGRMFSIRLDSEVTDQANRRVIELKHGDALGDCVWAWLGDNGSLVLPEQIISSHMTFRRTLAKCRSNLGFAWIQDGLRHTAATYHFQFYGDEAKTAQLLGHTNLDTLRTYYKGLTDSKTAKKFYALRPKAEKSKK